MTADVTDEDARGTRRVFALASVVAVATVALAAVYAGDGRVAGVSLWWWLLIPAFLLVEIHHIHVEFRREAHAFSMSAIPLVVGLYTVSPMALVLARVAGTAAAFIGYHRSPAYKVAVNVASHGLEAVTAIIVFRALVPADALSPGGWLAAFVAALAADVVGILVVTVAISLFEGRLELSFLGPVITGSVATLADTALALIGVTILAERPAALALLAAVAFMLVASYRAYGALLEQHRNLQLLYEYSRRLAAGVVEGTVASALLDQGRELMHAERAWLLLPASEEQIRHVEPGHETDDADDALDRELYRAATASTSARLWSAPGPLEELITGAGMKQVMATAMAMGGATGPRCVLAVADRSGRVRPFRDSDLSLFETIAGHAGVGLQNGHLIEQLRAEAADKEHRSLHDALTGLPNRVKFHQELSRSLVTDNPVAVLLIDLDRFKEVNDTLGHHNGDLLLVEVGERLRSTLRLGDVVARLGGDEFAVLIPDITSAEAAIQVANGVRSVLERPFDLADLTVDIRASVGIAVSPNHGRTPEILMQRSDVAMYVAKEDQSGVELYDPSRDSYSAERLTLVGELRTALDLRAIEVHFQPQADCRTRRVIGAEALVRWQHPDHGLIPPDEFVPIAEHTGLIRPLTRLVLEHAIDQCARWHAAGYPIRVSVNLSARNLLEPDLADDVTDMLQRWDVPAQALCLELTESTVMSDPRRTIAVLERLAAADLTIAIDDFGTGHSSLSYLQKLPVGEIKIDKSFVFGLGRVQSAEVIVGSIIDLGRNLGLPVLAEGVETDEAWDRLDELGCALVQGYRLSRPAAPDVFFDWLVAREGQPVPATPAGAEVIRLASRAGSPARR
jgi:diguanylate cyclase (GGDEF)-like protein